MLRGETVETETVLRWSLFLSFLAVFFALLSPPLPSRLENTRTSHLAFFLLTLPPFSPLHTNQCPRDFSPRFFFSRRLLVLASIAPPNTILPSRSKKTPPGPLYSKAAGFPNASSARWGSRSLLVPSSPPDYPLLFPDTMTGRFWLLFLPSFSPSSAKKVGADRPPPLNSCPFFGAPLSSFVLAPPYTPRDFADFFPLPPLLS